MKITVRDMCIEDAEGIVNVLNPIIKQGGLTVFDTPFAVEQEKEFLKKFPAGGIFHVAVGDNGKILGFQVLESFASFTHAMDHVASIGTYVDIAMQGSGIGMQLSQKTFEKAKELGFEKILTYVLAINKPALKFYNKLGFKILGRASRQAKLNGIYFDEIFIEKFL
ncbi:MAG: GNAT family N-acetyltransferase [Chloroflexi bacterium]|nr:GNAT family N-acetyltransferase [Chloroflexota bacterium]